MNVRTDGLLACFQDKKSPKKAIQGGPRRNGERLSPKGREPTISGRLTRSDLPGTSQAWVPQMILTLGTRNPGLSWENKSAHGEAARI